MIYVSNIEEVLTHCLKSGITKRPYLAKELANCAVKPCVPKVLIVMFVGHKNILCVYFHGLHKPQKRNCDGNVDLWHYMCICNYLVYTNFFTLTINSQFSY